MTPFDPIALVAMLLAFYPVVSSASLQRARLERPEYFAAGVLFGSKGDKLRLPDGREWDLIANSGLDVTQRHWQALYIDPNAPHIDDPFALEEGPLVPFDEELLAPRLEDHTFEQLAAEHLREFGGSDDVLHQAATSVAEFGGADALDNAYARTMEPAAAHHHALRASLDTDDPSELLGRSNAQGNTIDDESLKFDEPEPEDLEEVDPGSGPGETPVPPAPTPPAQ